MAEDSSNAVGTKAAIPSHVPVLCYHSVSDSPPADIARYSVTRAQFEEQLLLIKASGRVACSFGRLAARLAKDKSIENYVCITFDDGWRDHLDAAQMLSDADLPGTFFITSGLLNQPNMLSDDQLRELHAAPKVEIGAHSVSHPHLDELSIDDAFREIADSKAAIEAVVGETVDTFAYPNGSYSDKVIAAVKASGFTSAAAVKNALTHRGDDPFAVARWMLEADTTAAQFAAVMDGQGAPVAWDGYRLRTRAYRVVRQTRRKIGV